MQVLVGDINMGVDREGRALGAEREFPHKSEFLSHSSIAMYNDWYRISHSLDQPLDLCLHY